MRKITAATIEAWRAAAQRNQPWLHSTGPKPSAGNARVAANGKVRQKRLFSHQEMLAFAKIVASGTESRRPFPRRPWTTRPGRFYAVGDRMSRFESHGCDRMQRYRLGPPAFLDMSSTCIWA
jgi:hypothetical protein